MIMKRKSKQLVTIVSFLLIIVLLQSCATMTDIDLTPEATVVSEIIELPGMTKDNLYIMANSWMVDTFVNAESVIEFTDKEAGIIKGKYVISGLYEGLYGLSIRSTLTIEIKEGKARITIADPYRKYTSGLGEAYTNTNYDQLRSKTYFEANCFPRYKELIESFRSAVTIPKMSDF